MKKSVKLIINLSLVMTQMLFITTVKAAEPLKGQEIPPIPVIISDRPYMIVNDRQVTIDEIIRYSLEKNNDVASAKYDTAMVDTNYEKYRKNFYPCFNFESGVSRAENPFPLSVLYGSESTTVDTTASLSKKFTTGTTLSAGVDYQFSDTKYGEIDIPATGTFSLGNVKTNQPAFFVSLKQELLKNSFGYRDRLDLHTLENQKQQNYNSNIYRMSVLVSYVIIDFWQMASATLTHSTAEIHLKETQKLRNIIRNNISLGLMPAYVLNYYENLVSEAVIKQNQAYYNFSESARQLLVDMDLYEEKEIKRPEIFKMAFSAKAPEIDRELALKTAFANRSDYNNALIEIRNAEMQLKICRNDNLPSLTAELNARSYGYDSSFTDSWRDTSSAEYPTYSARIMATVPLDNTEQTVNERNAGYKLKQARLNLKKITQQVKTDVLNSVDRVNTAYEIYLHSKKSRIQSEKYYNGIIGNMRRGRLSASDIKNGLDSMIYSRQQEINALISYNTALLQLSISQNNLWKEYGIDIGKYIEGKKKGETISRNDTANR